jgi:hypothetical protein
VTRSSISWPQAHVDHAPPWEFAKLADAFLGYCEREGIDLSTERRETPNTARVSVLSDPATAEMWREFHSALATLRVVSAAENLRMGATLRAERR